MADETTHTLQPLQIFGSDTSLKFTVSFFYGNIIMPSCSCDGPIRPSSNLQLRVLSRTEIFDQIQSKLLAHIHEGVDVGLHLLLCPNVMKIYISIVLTMNFSEEVQLFLKLTSPVLRQFTLLLSLIPLNY